jgi:osmoprotectant transport system permease protein
MIQRPARLIGSLVAIGIVIALLCRAIDPSALHQYAPDLVYYTKRHLLLVGYSMAAALLVGIPAGILLSRPSFARHAERFMQIFNIGNTIPSLAVPALVALFLASLLPITRNAYEGMKNVSPALREAARGLGMTGWQSLMRVELPNAMPIIIGGVRTALAINVGSAPLAYLIGADSLGTLIFPGIYLNNQQQLLLGAAATAILALVLDGIVSTGSRYLLARRGVTA